MEEPASMPVKAKQIVDQKTALPSEKCGTRLVAVKLLAGPKRNHEITARHMTAAIGRMLPREPILLTHFPASTLRMLRRVIRVRETTEKPMK